MRPNSQLPVCSLIEILCQGVLGSIFAGYVSLLVGLNVTAVVQ